jgi:UDP-glucose 4-epimerase
MAVLLTGGTGYIGSHTAVELLKAGEEIVIVDNLCNSKIETVEKIKQITGKDFKFYKADVLDKEALTKIFDENNITEVIHFAGLKAVGESCEKPVEYYKNNVGGTLVLLEVMKEHGCKKIVFSSSATVYGAPKEVPIKEDFPLHTTNPYGTTKLFIEYILKDLYTSNNKWNITILRYFNPIGADKSGLIGENPRDIPNNLMPYIMKVATNELPILKIYGNDYNTVDGTGVRDYIHVVDLAHGHVLALKNPKKGIKIYNLGTGHGTSVLELVNTFEKVNNIEINKVIVERRPGDIDACYASCDKAYDELGFKATYSVDEMCRDAYNFIKKNTK